MLVATCPSREELLDFAVGKLSDEAADALAGHLDTCESCQAELAALSDADDTLVARLRGPLPPDPFLDEPECSRAVAIARAVGDCPDFCLSKNGTVPFDAPSTTNLPRLLGEYQLSSKLGSGGMGTVYKALHTKLGRIVALKVLTRARTHDPAAVARFEREMQAVGQLDHRHIVRAHDAREIDGTPILVMEYLDGLDLGEIVRRAGVPALAGNRPAPAKAGTPAPEIVRSGIRIPDAAELARQTAIGLQTIHEHGLVHRDIKPSNLMLTADGEVKILDLGLARLRPDMPPGEEMTATGQGMGTADYMAPEQASDSRAVDIRADIYSLGCTLYKLLTGRAPFSGPDYCTAFDKMTAHVHAAPPPVHSLAPAVPEGLAVIVNRMLAKNPANRFTTPAEAADALAPYCNGANLVALLKRAASSPPLPPGDGGSRSRLPSGTNSGRRENKNLPSPSGKGAGGDGRRWKRFVGLLVLLLMASGFGFALAIILRIHKDGKDTTVELPDGSNTRVSANGQVDVELPSGAKAVTKGERGELGALRVWTDSEGKTTVGRFNRLDQGKLVLDVGGASRVFPLEKLSFEDHEYVGRVLTARGAGVVITPPVDPAKAGRTAPLPIVRVTQPVVCNVCDYEEYTGRIERENNILIRVPEKGMPVFRFKRGTSVKKGDLLAEIVTKDDWPKLMEKGEALNQLALSLAGRGGRGGRAGATPPSNADAEEQWKSALADWNLARGNIKTVKILAPCSGNADPAFGPFLRGGRGGRGGENRMELEAGTLIGRITTSDSMVVTFDIDEHAVLAHRRVPDRRPNWELSLPVVFGLADDKGFPYRGEVTSVAADIDPQTHAQRWQAIVPNKDGIFMPGMSVRVRLIIGEPHKVILISDRVEFYTPSSGAAGQKEFSDSTVVGKQEDICVLDEGNSLRLRKVTLGRIYDYRFASVLDGLSAADWIVVENGSFRVPPPGRKVNPEKLTTSAPPWASISVPPTVTVAHPIAREVTDYQDFTGHIEAVQTAEIRARASGNLDKVCFKPGMSVKKGELLFEIDPRLYQAELDQAAGGVKQAQIRFNARKLDFDRIQILAKNKAVSQEEIDKAKSERDEAEAAAQTAEAALNVAHVRWDYTRITAPFAGKIGRSTLDAGNLVTADMTVLATLASTDPIYVYFDVDERTMLTILRTGNDRALSLPVSFGLPDEQGFPHQGKMDAADSRIDPSTGTARWRAVLPNKDGMLSPGMFVRVRLATSAPHRAIVVPKSAVASEGPPIRNIVRWYVLTVNDQNVVVRRDVEPRLVTDDDRSVAVTGLADDWVITSGFVSGLQQLKPGMTVTPEKAATGAK